MRIAFFSDLDLSVPSGGAIDYRSDLDGLIRAGYTVSEYVINAGHVLARSGTLDGFKADAFSILYFSGFKSLESFNRIHGSVSVPKVINIKDLHFLRELRCERLTGVRRNAAQVQLREVAALRTASVIFTYSAVEMEIIRGIIPSADVRLHYISYPELDFKCAVAPLRRFVLVGNFEHLPNLDGLRWFASLVFPSCKEFGIPLHIYGANADRLRVSDSLINHGRFKRLSDVFCAGDVLLSPLRFGAGVKIKAVEAALVGVPILCTPHTIEGLPFDDKSVFLFSDEPSFRYTVSRIISKPDLMIQRARLATRRVKHICNEDLLVRNMRDLSYLAGQVLSNI